MFKPYSQKAFDARVLGVAEKLELSLFEAITHIAAAEELEPETVSALISPELKTALETNLRSLHLLRKTVPPKPKRIRKSSK